MRRYPRTADDVDSDEEAEFLRMEYGSSPTPDDAAMSSTVATVVVPSRADASPALESVPKELSPAADGANEGMHCTKCTGERKRGPHTCSKKRNAPAVTQTDGARASRQRSSSTAPLLALDSAPASADSAQASAANQVEMTGSIGMGDNRSGAAVDMDVSSPSDQVRARCCSAETESTPGT